MALPVRDRIGPSAQRQRIECVLRVIPVAGDLGEVGQHHARHGDRHRPLPWLDLELKRRIAERRTNGIVFLDP